MSGINVFILSYIFYLFIFHKYSNYDFIKIVIRREK